MGSRRTDRWYLPCLPLRGRTNDRCGVPSLLTAARHPEPGTGSGARDALRLAVDTTTTPLGRQLEGGLSGAPPRPQRPYRPGGSAMDVTSLSTFSLQVSRVMRMTGVEAMRCGASLVMLPSGVSFIHTKYYSRNGAVASGHLPTTLMRRRDWTDGHVACLWAMIRESLRRSEKPPPWGMRPQGCCPPRTGHPERPALAAAASSQGTCAAGVDCGMRAC